MRLNPRPSESTLGVYTNLTRNLKQIMHQQHSTLIRCDAGKIAYATSTSTSPSKRICAKVISHHLASVYTHTQKRIHTLAKQIDPSTNETLTRTRIVPIICATLNRLTSAEHRHNMRIEHTHVGPLVLAQTRTHASVCLRICAAHYIVGSLTGTVVDGYDYDWQRMCLPTHLL